MLTAEGFSHVLARLEQLAHDRDVARRDEKRALAETQRLDRQVGDLNSQLIAEQRRTAAYRAEVESLKKKAEFPFLIDRKNHIFVAFEDGNLRVTAAKDDDGTYQSQGDLPDYAALIGAPINPRCYLTCAAMNLIRVAAPPTGKLRLDDDVPF